MEIVLGVILLVSILALVFYCFKGHNIMVGFFIIATLWLVIGLIGNAVITEGVYVNDKFGGKQGLEAVLFGIQQVFQVGPQNYSRDILTNIFFGAFFGRVLLETNIAATIIKKTVELGGDRPRVTMTLLSIVTAILFVNMTGIGPVMAIAVIVLPILLTIGIKPGVALFSFMGSIMAGILVNPVNFNQYWNIVKNAVTEGGITDSGFIDAANSYTYGDYSLFGWIGLVVVLVGVLLVSNIALGFNKKSYEWAVDAQNTSGAPVKKDAPWYSWIAILIPVVLITLFNMLKYENAQGVMVSYTGFSAILAFIIASLYALITTGHLKGGYKAVCGKLSKLFADGAMDAAPMIGFLLTLAMFNTAAGLNVPYLRAIVGNIIPSSALGLTALFAVVSVFSFFRGPINLVGSGAAFATIVFISLGNAGAVALGFPFIYMLFSVTTVVPQHLDITQSWVAWGFGYTNVNPKQFMKMSIPTGYILAIFLCFLAFFMFGL